MRTGPVREAFIVLLVGLIGGAVLVQFADRALHLGPVMGDVLFSALPLVAAFVAATRLDPDEPDEPRGKA